MSATDQDPNTHQIDTTHPVANGAARRPGRRDLGDGKTIKELSRRWRVSCDTLRSWIRRGLLRAHNTTLSHLKKPRYVVTVEEIMRFEQEQLAVTPEPPPRPRRQRRRQLPARDYFPD
jgi:hypothetical protein